MTSPLPDPSTVRGPTAWMIRNRVTPNLLMTLLILGGLAMSYLIRQEVFPEMPSDTVTVRVPYPGASPEEVEQGILLSIEEGVRGLEGVKEVRSTAAQGAGTVVIELHTSADAQTVYQNILQEVNRIRTFPEDAEKPVVTLDIARREVLSLAVHGEAPPFELRQIAEEVRDSLLAKPGITQVELQNIPEREIHIEASEQALRAHGLSLQDIAQRIGAAAVELPGGSVKTASGEILVRFQDRRDWAREFAAIPLVAAPNGAMLTLGDLATVREGFRDIDRETAYNGRPAINLGIRRSGSETPVGLAKAAREVLDALAARLPPGVEVTVTNDSSEMYAQRLDLLLRNAAQGLALVFLLLGLFLEIKLALWVILGIPVSFIGSLLFMPVMGVTINMISLFAFIIALGIVVDDAVLVGENIYEYRAQGHSHVNAAILATRDIVKPLAFCIATNIAAFLPLMFIPGPIGRIFGVIPGVIISVFLISWFESVFILPSHLAHAGSKPASRLTALLHGWQQRFGDLFNRMVRTLFGPLLERLLRWRMLTIASFVVLLLLTLVYVASGRIGRTFMPRVEADRAVATARLPVGSPVALAREVRDRLTAAAREIEKAAPAGSLVTGISASINENTVEVEVILTDPEVRPFGSGEFVNRWRRGSGQIAGVDSLQFASDRGGPGAGAALTVELSHRDTEVLRQASAVLASRLTEFARVKDIQDGYVPGKAQMDFRLTEQGRSLGLTSAVVARQVRSAFYGAEALRQQRGRNEVTVLARSPEDRRTHEHDVESLLIRTPAGKDVPLFEVAEVSRGRAYTTITRRDGRRTVSVTANVDPIGETAKVQKDLDLTVFPPLQEAFPGLTISYEGRQADFAEGTDAMFIGMLAIIGMVYFLVASPLRSYSQPLIVLASIPFGLIGAVLGHVLMGFEISLMSMMGMIALAGVAVNTAIVLLEYANRLRDEEGASAHDAILAASVRRFRPIMLTTLTTFGGLMPMIFETSRQARFLIPMAISLGFGILFATFISLLLVPCLYLLNDDVARFLRLFREEEEA